MFPDIDGDTIVFSTDAEMQTMLHHHREELKIGRVKIESNGFFFFAYLKHLNDNSCWTV